MGGRLRKQVKMGMLMALASALSACGTYSSTQLGAGAKEVAKAAPGMAKDAGAAIVIRVSLSGSYCANGQVVLNKIVDGKIDKNQSVTIGQVGSGNLGDGLKDIGKMYVRFLTLNVPAIVKEVDKGDIRTSYRPIAPGSYVATYASCSIGRTQATMGGNEGGSLFKAPPPPVLRPLLGANYIVIGNGQIVDAGILDIKVLSQQYRFTGPGIAMLIGSEAPPVFRETIRKNLPELYPKITYSKFTPYPGLLAPVPIK
jgi:hypothetical protein